MSADTRPSTMRGSVLVLTTLLALASLAPPVAADSATLETRDGSGASRTAYEDGETVVFRVTVRVSQTGPVAHRIYLYEGVGAAADLVGVHDTGTTSTASRSFDHVFEIPWDQRLDGVRVPAGQYTAQFRAPDGAVAVARLDLDWGPDMVLSRLAVETTAAAGVVSPTMSATGCVRNDGVQPVAAARMTLAFFEETTQAWTSSPVTTDVVLGDPGQCPWYPARGTPFSILFAAPPGLRAVRATADAPGTAEQDPGDETRTVAARWAI